MLPLNHLLQTDQLLLLLSKFNNTYIMLNILYPDQAWCLVWVSFGFGLLLYVTVNNYGLVGRVNSPDHTSYWGKLEQVVNLYFVHIHSLVTGNIPTWMNQQNRGELP